MARTPRRLPSLPALLGTAALLLPLFSAAATTLAPRSDGASAPAPAAAAPTVTLRNGSYAGVHLAHYDQDVFLGIPYAQSAGGPNRFRVPQALNESWDGVRNADRYGNQCPDDAPPREGAGYGMSEDCLSLNVVRPAGGSVVAGGEGSGEGEEDGEAGLLPVMVWIHGGSYQRGTTGLPHYNLTFLVQRSVEIGRPVVGVSINYRKGGWGNMYSIEIAGSGNTNLALRDMRQALAWLQENVRAFGGDPECVTIWGESSGSFAVGQLLLSYGGRSDGLFHRSIQESGSAATAWHNGTEWYQPIYDNIVEQVNCSEAIDTLECLRTVPYEDLLPYVNSSAVVGPGWYPTVDGDIVPGYPTELLQSGRFAKVPRLYGSNSDEGTDNAPVGAINTDDDLYEFLLNGVGFGYTPAAVREIMQLYPDDPTQGIPLDTGNERFADLGWQYKRTAAIVGDIFYHSPRLYDARQYAKYGGDTFIYRFNTRAYVVNVTATTAIASDQLAPPAKGVAHFAEVAFVFNSLAVGGPEEYQALSDQMSAQWITFAHDGTPNGEGLPQWPSYDQGESGYNLVLQTESQGGSIVEPDTYRLAGREFLAKWQRRRHV